MSPLTVFFFRGLSTVGSDHARFSKLDFGPVYKYLAKAIQKQNLDFVPVLNMGKGSLDEISKRAEQFIKNHPAWQNPNSKVHFLGHSAGGLIARLTLEKLNAESTGKVKSLLTVSTPHRGSKIAQIFFDMPKNHQGSTRLLKSIGFDVLQKRELFADLTPEGVRRHLPASDLLPKGVACGSIVCCAPRANWCRPLKLAHRLRPFKEFDLPSDGVVEKQSQFFAELIGEFELDHIRQMGFFGETKEFHQIWTLASDFFKQAH